jgi:S1-C subfamily serine protease
MQRFSAKLVTVIALIVALAGMPAASVLAQKMHRWVDEDGQVHFSQTPPPDQDVRETETVTYGEDRSGSVDRACCERVRRLAGVSASYLQRGLTLMQLQQEYPPSQYPFATEIFNHVSFNASAGDSPTAVASRAFNTCMNRGFQACRLDSGPDQAEGSAVASSGSGVVIGDGLVMTNEHVVGDCSRVTVTDARVSAEVVAADGGTDLAVLEARLEGKRSVSLVSVDKPRLGQSIVVAGYPLSSVLESLNLTTGTVSSEGGIRGSRTLFQVTAPIQPGNSGGPVFDSGGRMIGVVVSRLADVPMLRNYASLPQNVNFAITPVAVKTFLRQHGIDFRVSSAQSSMSTEAIGERAKRNTVRIFCHP